MFLVFEVALVSYRVLNLQIANKTTSIQDSFVIQLLVSTSKLCFFYESVDYSHFIFSISETDYLKAVNCVM